MSRIRSIGGAAQVSIIFQIFQIAANHFQQHALVWWKSTTIPSLSSLDPHVLLHNHFPSQSFSLPNTPTAQDTSSHTHALAIEALLGGPDRMVDRVGTCASPALVAGQLLRIRESWPQDVWARTGRIQLASAFLGSLISGKWLGMGEAEASATGLWVHAPQNASQPGVQGHWDEDVLDIVGGSREEGRRVRGWLGDVDGSCGGRRAGNVSRYLVERYGFEPGRSFQESWRLLLTLYSFRYYCGSLYVGLSIIIHFTITFFKRCSPFIWTHGYIDDSSTTLSSHTIIQLIPSSRSRPWREKKIYSSSDQQVMILYCYSYNILLTFRLEMQMFHGHSSVTCTRKAGVPSIALSPSCLLVVLLG